MDDNPKRVDTYRGLRAGETRTKVPQFLTHFRTCPACSNAPLVPWLPEEIDDARRHNLNDEENERSQPEAHLVG